MSYSITLTKPTSIDAVGFRARRAGLEVRDCLLILEPGNQARLGLLAKRETNTTVVEGYVREETGVLDLDRCRIVMSSSDMDMLEAKASKSPREAVNPIYGKYEKAIAVPGHTSGRFPANLILVHGSTCTCEGTKKVKSGIAVQRNRDGEVHNQIYGAYRKPPTDDHGYASEDGTEEVPNWICEQECPVALLDAQSGERPSTLSRLGHHGPNPSSVVKPGSGWGMSGGGLVYGDTGGASRFFKQVQEEDELDAYLSLLVRKGY